MSCLYPCNNLWVTRLEPQKRTRLRGLSQNAVQISDFFFNYKQCLHNFLSFFLIFTTFGNLKWVLHSEFWGDKMRPAGIKFTIVNSQFLISL